MKTKSFLTYTFFFLAFQSRIFAQAPLRGILLDATTATPLQAAWVGLEGRPGSWTTGEDGRFEIPDVKPGRYVLRASLVGYFPVQMPIQFQEGLALEVKMQVRNSLTEEVIVQATRSRNEDPTTRSTVERKELDKLNLGQDLPILLQQATSVVSTSDAGGGVGYTGLSIRGSDATRINVTMNGIPVNDAESHGLFWVNMPDFASSIQNIQIQRGVGTSTNGSSAFGASLNIQTNTLRKDAFAETHHSIGSFGTLKNNVLAGTGLLDGKWALETRISRISSEGFIDRGSANLNSFYLSGGYYGKKGILKWNLIDGSEKTYQAWNGVPEARLKNDLPGMLDYISRNGLSPSDSAHLVNSSSRSYNAFRYKNQTDNYRQTHYQLFYSYDLGREWMLNTAVHYTRGAGYYEEFKPGESYGEYGMENPVIGGDTLQSTDLIRQRWLDNHFYGATYSVTHSTDKADLVLGGSANQYRGDHFGKVIWARNSTLPDNTFRYYDNLGVKTDVTHYAKLGYRFGAGWRAYGDLQVRLLRYQFEGFDQNLNPTDQSVDFAFFNPKAGISYQPDSRILYYLSYAKAQREPVRDDFVNSSPQSRPRPEVLHNLELGTRYQNDQLQFSANLYYMQYRDQLILTGEINDVGAYIRSNVASSYRSGMELEARYQILPSWALSGNLTLSRNRIAEYEYFLDNYDAGGQEKQVFKNKPIAFSPDMIGAGELTWSPGKNLEAALIGKWVGRQYLDNTGSESKSLDPYRLVHFRAGYRIYQPWIKELSLSLLINNILNHAYEANGYTYGYIAGGRTVTENFYFPQAGRNFLIGVSMKW